MSARRRPTGGDAPIATAGGRYELIAPISGSGGSVWRGRDRITGDAVAVKRVSVPPAGAAFLRRREPAALRLLRVPGIVALRDEVRDGDATFLVLDLVDGIPFPGPGIDGEAARPGFPWHLLRERTRGLLEALARAHALGVYHGDVKPANVLVDADGRVSLVDFELSAGPGVDVRGVAPPGISGTTAYMAPEAMERGVADTRTDVYSVGAMLYEVATGDVPHAGAEYAAVLVARRDLPAPRIDRGPTVPPAGFADFVAALIAPRREDRPGDAAAALRLLGGTAEEDVEVRAAAAVAALPAGENPPVGLFHGPDAILHLREDAAAELLRRVGPDRQRQASELAAWVRAGVARWEGERLRVERADLDALRDGLPVRPGVAAGGAGTRGARLLERLARGDLDGAVEDACARAARADDELDLGGAAAEIRAVLAAARVACGADAERRLLGHLVHLATLTGTRAAAMEALYEVERRAGETPELERIEHLAHALVHAATATTPAAGRDALSLAPFDELHLEWARLAVHVVAARRRGRDASARALQDAVDAWAHRSEVLLGAALAKWRGFHEFLHGSFREAALLLDRAVALAPRRLARIAARADATSAHVAAGSFDRAEAHIAAARRELGSCRHAGVEAILLLHEVSIAYRTGREIPPLDDALDALRRTEGDLDHGCILAYAAAAAWRAGDGALALARAREAARRAASGGAVAAEFLALALMHLCGDREPACDLDRLVARALGSGPPLIRLQVLALAALGGRPPEAGWRAVAEEALAPIEPEMRAHRREVLSHDECVAALEGRWAPPLPGVRGGGEPGGPTGAGPSPPSGRVSVPEGRKGGRHG